MKTDLHGADQDTTLLAWWLDELDAAETSEIEEHLFGCDTCAARLQELIALRNSVRGALLDGHFVTTVTAASIRRLEHAGLRVRKYRPPAGGSVLCTIAPQDDLVASYLEAPLADVRQLDLVIDDGEAQHRLAHIPFDAAAQEVTVIPPVAVLRGLGKTTQRMRLLAVTQDSERVLGEYTFNHEPWGT